jgi:hypothetical protein
MIGRVRGIRGQKHTQQTELRQVRGGEFVAVGYLESRLASEAQQRH